MIVMKRFMFTAVTLLLLLLPGRADAQSANFKIGKSLDVQMNVLKELSLLYVDSIDSEKLIMRAIDAMLESLDPYTVMIPAEDHNWLLRRNWGAHKKGGKFGSALRDL